MYNVWLEVYSQMTFRKHMGKNLTTGALCFKNRAILRTSPLPQKYEVSWPSEAILYIKTFSYTS